MGETIHATQQWVIDNFSMNPTYLTNAWEFTTGPDDPVVDFPIPFNLDGSINDIDDIVDFTLNGIHIPNRYLIHEGEGLIKLTDCLGTLGIMLPLEWNIIIKYNIIENGQSF